MARPPTGKIPPQAIMHLRSRHREMMYRLVAGETQAAISVTMDITQTRLSIIVNSPLFKKELSKLEKKIYDNVVETRGDISARIKELQPKALTVIEDIMMGPKVGKSLKRQCANDILELGQKRGPAGEDDGLNHFARVIAEAFDMAEHAQEPHSNGSGNDNDNGNAGAKDVVVDIGASDVIEAEIKPENESETEDEAKDEDEDEENSVSAVEEVLSELGIMD